MGHLPQSLIAFRGRLCILCVYSCFLYKFALMGDLASCLVNPCNEGLLSAVIAELVGGHLHGFAETPGEIVAVGKAAVKGNIGDGSIGAC